MADNMVRVSVATGCIYFGVCPSSLVFTRAASASEMHWSAAARTWEEAVTRTAKNIKENLGK